MAECSDSFSLELPRSSSAESHRYLRCGMSAVAASGARRRRDVASRVLRMWSIMVFVFLALVFLILVTLVGAQVKIKLRSSVVEPVRQRCRSHCRPGAGAGSGSETRVPEPVWDRGAELPHRTYLVRVPPAGIGPAHPV